MAFTSVAAFHMTKAIVKRINQFLQCVYIYETNSKILYFRILSVCDCSIACLSVGLTPAKDCIEYIE